MKLHGYFRSSAAYRVRIALNLKGLFAEHLPHHLRKGEQTAPDYLVLNPQGLVPTLEDDEGGVLTQSPSARRFGVDVAAFPRLLQAEAAAKAMQEFADAAPDRQSDAE
ncbi:MAG: glutathione S-transferase N-terminal domain-containing protein [Bradyrhizobium sp.]|nr:glutathione S-transferase N-terminal domain-containing protein [Bradyrhizobium sp.]